MQNRLILRGVIMSFDLDDIYIYLVDMPHSIKANVAENIDGTHTIYLNSRLNNYEMKKSLDHELRHIRNNDLNNSCDIHEIELKARSAI